jgi:hypothetical protein
MRTLTLTGRPLSDIFQGELILPCEQSPVFRGLFHYSRMKSATRKPRSRNNCVSKYSRIHGAIRRYSGLPKLRKPIFAFYYSRLLTWVNAIDEGLNPHCSFNLVSAARNRPSGDPNCELFPQGPIIPVPPSTPSCRPVGAYGNNCAVFPGRDAKKKASEPEGSEAVIPTISLVALSCGDAETVSGGTRQHQNASSEASSRYSHSMVAGGLDVMS